MQIILQRYANREYRLTQQTIAKRDRVLGDKYAEKQNEKYAQAVHDTYVLDQGFKNGLIGASPEDGGRVHSFGEVDARLGIRALDIIDEFRQKTVCFQRRGGWGFQAKPTSFTKNARHRLLEAGAVIDQEFGLNCYEVSLTLPGSLDAAFKVVAAYSGWLCDRLLREVRRNPETQHWFYVWEFQKRGALHMHFAIAGSNLSEVKKVAQKLEYMWFELLLELEEKTGVELFRKNRRATWRNRPEKWQSHVAPITKSCAAYFSKYASKCSNPGKQRNSPYYYPARWWGSSRAIKQGINLRRHRYEFEGSNADMGKIFSYLRSWLDDPSKIKSYSYNFDLGKSKLGNPLGGGEVEISYYQDEGFVRMQTWEPYVIEHCLSIGELDADILSRRHDVYSLAEIDQVFNKNPSSKLALSPHPASSKPSPAVSSDVLQEVLRREPTLAIRARLLRYLSERGGDLVTSFPLGDIQIELDLGC